MAILPFAALAQTPPVKKPFPAQTASAKHAAPAAPAIPAVPSPQPAIATSETQAKELRKGVLIGQVVDSAGKPVQGATVAVLENGGKVLAWAKTDASGEYRIPADPKTALNLRPSRTKGLLVRCADAVGSVVEDAFGAVVGTVTAPGEAAKAAATAIAGGTSASQTVESQTALPNSSAVGPTEQSAGGASANAALSPEKGVMADASDRGASLLLISAPGFQDARLKDTAYWLDPPAEVEKHRVGVQAWMQTVKLVPTSGKGKSDAIPAAVTLADASVQPDVAPAGTDVEIKVKLDAPDPAIIAKSRVFARLTCKPTVVELSPSPTDKGFYEGKMHIDERAPAGATTISIGALREDPVEVRFRKSDKKALLEFARREPDLQAGHPYGYDPFVMASVNRMDVKLTILPAKK